MMNMLYYRKNAKKITLPLVVLVVTNLNPEPEDLTNKEL